MNYYEAKFAREAKERPTHWMIAPGARRNTYRLVRIRP